jgi:hypothetical protein
MTISERIRETCNGSIDPKYLRAREDGGWRLVGVEWERQTPLPTPHSAKPESPAEPKATALPVEDRRVEAPLGARVASDCDHLEENPDEMQFLFSVMELIIQDISITKVAEELNRRGFRNRAGNEWGPIAIFNLLPRLIELTPRIFRSQEWVERRKQLTPVF